MGNIQIAEGQCYKTSIGNYYATIGRFSAGRWEVTWSHNGGASYVEEALITGWLRNGEWKLEPPAEPVITLGSLWRSKETSRYSSTFIFRVLSADAQCSGFFGQAVENGECVGYELAYTRAQLLGMFDSYYEPPKVKVVGNLLEKLAEVEAPFVPQPVMVGDLWRWPNGKLCEVHSAVQPSGGDVPLYSCIIDGAQITQTLDEETIRSGSQGKLERRRVPKEKACVLCDQIPVEGFSYEFVVHYCPKATTASRVQALLERADRDGDVISSDWHSALWWVRGRRAELVAAGFTQQNLDAIGYCCTIGGVHHLREERCPIHHPPAPYGNGEFDVLDFLRP